MWKKEISARAYIGLFAVIALLALIFSIQAAPAILDAAGDDYVIVEGAIERFSGTGTYGNGVYYGGAYIVADDGETIQIQFPLGVSNVFSNGKFYGTVVFGKRSHYLVDVFPGKSIEEAIAVSEQLQVLSDDLTFPYS